MSPTVTAHSLDFSHIKAIASDLDGTLVVGKHNGINGRLSQRSIDALHALEEKNIYVIMASGRPPRDMLPIAAESGLKNPLLIACNGATVLDSQTQHIIQKYSIATEAVRELVKAVKDHFGPENVFVGGESGCGFRCEEAYAQKYWYRVGNVYTRVDDLNDLANEHDTIEKLQITHKEWEAAQLYNYMQEHVLTDPKWKDMVCCTYSNTHYVEVSAVGVCKGSAIKDLCEKINVHAEELVAFGDMPNDIQMIQFAGVGVAMANGHPQLKEVADLITLQNTEDGVAVVLEQIAKEI